MNFLFMLFIVHFIYCKSSENYKKPPKDGIKLRIAGGYASVEVPDYYVALINANSPVKDALVFCGSTLITDQHLLTAAHCYVDQTSRESCQEYKAVFRLQDKCAGHFSEVIPIKHCHIHAAFDPVTFVNDIAILILNKKVNYTPARLPIINGALIHILQIHNLPVSILGYGTLSQNSMKTPCIIRMGVLAVMPYTICEEKDIGWHVYSKSMLCAASKNYDIATCKGDSGGGMIYKYGNDDIVVGITSFNLGCSRPDNPGVYTFVPYYMQWIQSILYLPNSARANPYLRLKRKGAKRRPSTDIARCR